MKKISTLLFALILPLHLSAQRYTGYGRGSDYGGSDGFFFVSGDNAISGIIILIGCGIVAFVCYKIAETVSKKDKSKGDNNTVSTILNTIGCIACIAVIALAFTLWWITLIIFIIAIIGSVIYQKIEDRKERNKNVSNQEVEKKEIKVPQIEQNTENSLEETDDFIGDDATEDVVFIKDWPLLTFVKTFGYKTMQVGSFTYTTNNGEFNVCIFIKADKNRAFAYFLPDLGELSPREIANRKDELYIGETSEEKFFLYSKGCKGWRLEPQKEPSTVTVKENETINKKDTTNNSSSSYRDNNYGITTLTVEQKMALLGMTTFLGASSTLKNKKNEVAKVLGDFRHLLRLSNEDLKDAHFEQFLANRQKCIDTVKTIHKDGPFIMFITTCMQLAEIDDFSIFIDYEFQKILREIGFTQKEIQAINNNAYIFRFENKN